MPPPERPCGRTASRREPQQLGVVADEDQLCVVAGQLDRTHHPVARVEPDDLPGRPCPAPPGFTRLTTPRAVPRASPADAGARVVRHSARSSVSRVTSSLTWVPPCRFRRVGGGRHGRQVQRVDLDQPPGAGDQPEVGAGGGHDRGDDHVVVGALAAGRQRIGVVGPGQQAGRGHQHPARVVGHLERRAGGHGRHAAGGQQDGAPRGAVLLGDLGQFQPRRRSAAARDSPGSGSARRSSRCSWSRSASSSIRLNLVSRRSGMSRM